jgi:hypothetical protein
MKKIILPILLIMAFILAMPAASMAGNGRGHYKHGYRGYGGYHGYGGYRGYGYNNGPYFNANFFYGPAYYPRPYVYYPPPPPVIYAPPPVYYGPSYYPPVTGSFNFGIVID